MPGNHPRRARAGTPAIARQVCARVALVGGLLQAYACHDDRDAPPCAVTSVPAELELEPFYEKYCDATGGLPVVASSAVSDAALHSAAALVARVLGERPALREAIVAAGGRVALIGQHEKLTDLPEAFDVYVPDREPEALRGLAFVDGPVMAISSEENVLCWPVSSNALQPHSVLLHELAHVIHVVGLADARREGAELLFGEELQLAYDDAMANGLWADTYAASNAREYWAEGVGIYFASPLSTSGTGRDVGVETRSALQDYDPALFELLHWTFGDDDWHPRCPSAKRAPLAGRTCRKSDRGDDVIFFSIPGESADGSLSGTIHLPRPLTEARELRVWLQGQSDDSESVSAVLTTFREVAAQGARAVRYAIDDIPPGQYLVKAAIDPDGYDFDPDTTWTGVHEAQVEGTDAVSVGSSRRCGVDITLHESDGS